MALYIPHSIFHLARLLYVRPETFGPYYVYVKSVGVQPESFRFEVGVVRYRTGGVYHENHLGVCTCMRAHAVVPVQRNNLGASLRNSVA